MTKVPAPPKPPPVRVIKDGAYYICPKCHSTAYRTWWFFGELICHSKECQDGTTS